MAGPLAAAGIRSYVHIVILVMQGPIAFIKLKIAQGTTGLMMDKQELASSLKERHNVTLAHRL